MTRVARRRRSHHRIRAAAPKGEGALDLDAFDGRTRGLVALVGSAALRGERYGVGAFANYERLLGNSADSPIVRHKDVWRAGLIVVRRFSWN